MSADEVGMMEEEGIVELNDEMQGMSEEVPEGVPGMMMDEPGMAVDDPGMLEEPGPMEPWLDVPQGVVLVPAPEGLIDPSTLEAHPLTNSMPFKSEREYEALKESIRINGLQQPLTRFEGMVLDGRHRLKSCLEEGIPVAVMDFVGSSDDALVYVLQSNQYHHDYGTGQRAAVAALLLPEIAERVNHGRIEKLCATLDLKRQGECSQEIGNTPETADSRTRTHAIAGAMMRVNHAYVEYAARIQREAPDLFRQLHAGTITMQEALKTFRGEIDDAQQRETKAARSEFNRALRNPDQYPDFLRRFRAFMAQFASATG